METKYGQLPDEMLDAYFNKLIGMTFKVLPMKEEDIASLPTYLESFLCELHGEKELINSLREDGDFLRLLGILEYLLNNYEEIDKEIVKREVFKGINIVKTLQKKYIKED